ncbi:site-specific integrase, partial [Hominenteromicrobium sp.]
TGLRRGELQNLRWQDWDKKAKVLRVEKSKTENGIRSVPVIPEVALMLTHLQGWAKRGSSNRYIFGDAEPVSAGHLRHICLYTSKCAGIRRVSPHMLRHTFATRMIENGSDAKSLALIIGHSNPAFTLRRYVHPDHTSLYEQMCRLSSIQQ